jgi:hypothetical protein
MQFPFQDVISTMDEVPSEHHFFTPQTNDVAGVDRNPWLAKLDNSLFDSIARLWYCRFT